MYVHICTYLVVYFWPWASQIVDMYATLLPAYLGVPPPSPPSGVSATQPLALQSSNILFDEAAVRRCMRRWLSQCSHRLAPPGAARCKSPLHNSLYLGLWRRRRRRGCWSICARPFNRKGAGSLEKHYTATFFQGRRKPLYNWNTIVELSLLIAAAAAVAAQQARRQRWQRGGGGLPHASEAFLLKQQQWERKEPFKRPSRTMERRVVPPPTNAAAAPPSPPLPVARSRRRHATKVKGGELWPWRFCTDASFFYTYSMWRKMKIDHFLFFLLFYLLSGLEIALLTIT